MRQYAPMTTATEGVDDQQLRRGLKNRHIQLIALGGAIGTGLFYGAGASISLAGPAILPLVGWLIWWVGLPSHDDSPPP